MNYEQEEFFELVERVEDQSGELLDDLCAKHTYEFTGEHHKPVTMPGCGLQTMLRIPYEGQNVKGKSLGLRPVVVCAVEDSVGAWPRFGADLGVEP